MEDFYHDLEALVEKYRDSELKGHTTLWAVSLAYYRKDMDRLDALDNTALAMEREYLHKFFKIKEPVECLNKSGINDTTTSCNVVFK